MLELQLVTSKRKNKKGQSAEKRWLFQLMLNELNERVEHPFMNVSKFGLR